MYMYIHCTYNMYKMYVAGLCSFVGMSTPILHVHVYIHVHCTCIYSVCDTVYRCTCTCTIHLYIHVHVLCTCTLYTILVLCSLCSLAQLVSPPNVVREIDWINRHWPDNPTEQATYSKPQVRVHHSSLPTLAIHV